MKTKSIIFLLVFCFIEYCSVENIKAKSILPKSNIETDTSKLRFNGLYRAHCTHLHACNCANDSNVDSSIIRFFIGLTHDGRIFNNSIGSTNYPVDLSNKWFHLSQGSYQIVNDSIYATMPTLFYVKGMRSKYFITNYAGYIKSEDSIVGWRIVSPYPKIKLNLNAHFFNDTIPKTLYFVENK